MTLPELAKLSVETYIKEGKIISPPDDLPKKFLKKRAGTFVTIEKELRGLPRKEPKPSTRAKHGAGLVPHRNEVSGAGVLLRGCIGTYLPTRVNIAEEIIHNAIAAATEDYRFGPIKKEELPYLSYTVYILSEPKPVKDIKDLDPKKFGIIIKTTPFAYPNEDVVFDGHAPFKSGLLLPDLDGIDTIEKQISIACKKGGIKPTKEKILIYKFTVEKYE